MRNFTKTLTIVVISLFSLQSNAQTFGLKGGLNLSTLFAKDNDQTYSDAFKTNPGFHFGATVDIPFNSFLSFESGLLLTTKGMKNEESYWGVSIKADADLYYLEIPITLKASHNFGKGLKIFGVVGPYAGVGLYGKVKSTTIYFGNEEFEEADVEWGNNADEDELKRLDLGLTVGGGIEIKSITLGISYDLGLSNNIAYQENGGIAHNRVLKVSVGYWFGD